MYIFLPRIVVFVVVEVENINIPRVGPLLVIFYLLVQLICIVYSNTRLSALAQFYEINRVIGAVV